MALTCGVPHHRLGDCIEKTGSNQLCSALWFTAGELFPGPQTNSDLDIHPVADQYVHRNTDSPLTHADRDHAPITHADLFPYAYRNPGRDGLEPLSQRAGFSHCTPIG